MNKGISFKKLLSIFLTLIMVFSLAACAGGVTVEEEKDQKESKAEVKNGDASDESGTAGDGQGKVLRIYAWNEEFQSRFNDYFLASGKLPADVEVEWVITPNADNAYQNKLDADLLSQDSAEEPIDIFLIEADYALKYVDSDYTLDVLGDIGLTGGDIASQYAYTQEIVTDGDGVLKGVTWQATPGLFAYRRSIAKDVLGSDDPATVQTYLADWTKFNEVAVMAADKGYKMLSGYDDSYRTFSNNMSAPWVDENYKIHIDDNLMAWVDQTKSFTDMDYNNKTTLWADGWAADQGPDGKVFGFFYSTWGINFTLLGNSLATPTSEGGVAEVGNGIYGDWAVTEGPESYYWGGTWICAAKGTDNTDLIKEVMYQLTCDEETMNKITVETQDYTNNQAAMEALGNSDFQSDFLGGQNHIALFAAAAPKIDMSNLSKYDQGMNEEFQEAFKDYFDGVVTKEEALDNFYTSVSEKYPNLEK